MNLKVNDQPVDADNILYNGTTYIPLRKTAEILGCDVGWDSDTDTAIITQYDDNKLLAFSFDNLEEVSRIASMSYATMNLIDYNFTKSYWSYRLESGSRFDYLTNYFNWISEKYKKLTDSRETFEQIVAGVTSSENVSTLYQNLNDMYGKLCFIYSAVKNLVTSSGYICTDNEFEDAISEYHSLFLNADSYRYNIHLDLLTYLYE